MSWRIFYADRTSLASWDGPTQDAPAEGVQVIAEKRAGRTLIHNMGEVYHWDGSGWESLTQVNESYPEDAVVLRGSLIENEQFKAIREEAMLWLHPGPY